MSSSFVWFYDQKANESTYYLSNYYPTSVNEYPCSEAAYQASKFLDIHVQQRFKSLDGPSSWVLAQELKKTETVRQDWSDVTKISVMKEVVRQKFGTNVELKHRLLSTNDAYLVEHGRDKFWGDGGRRKEGKNWLGTVLMMVREELGGIGPVPAPSVYLEARSLKAITS